MVRRALQVGKTHRHSVALAFQSALGSEDLLDEVLRSVGIHEDRRARQSDRASAQGAQKADAQGWPVPGDEATGTLRETLRQAKAEAGPGQKETSQGDEAGLAP